MTINLTGLSWVIALIVGYYLVLFVVSLARRPPQSRRSSRSW